MQQGDISDAAEAYLKARDLDKKTIEKFKVNANYFCQQLGKYRMPFAWTAINVLELLAGNQVWFRAIKVFLMIGLLIDYFRFNNIIDLIE